ncbi:Putative AC transposase [Linum grandiflorum]
MLSRVKNNVPIIRYINLLAIPITSVASEAAFSSGGRLLDPHRSRLDPSTVEAMMRARSWIQDEGRGATAKAMAELEGVFSSLTMDDPTVEDGIGKS